MKPNFQKTKSLRMKLKIKVIIKILTLKKKIDINPD
jgi:hypothetical protein